MTAQIRPAADEPEETPVIVGQVDVLPDDGPPVVPDCGEWPPNFDHWGHEGGGG